MFSTPLAAVLGLVGGVALFLLGMELLGEGLEKSAGVRVRRMLARMTANRLKGAGAGTTASTLIHSGPTTVIVMSYVNAGLLSLAAAIPVVFGANIGTTLSMQIVAFDVGKWSFAIVAAGLVLRRVGRSRLQEHLSLVVIGFGLLFLGLELMKTAFGPLSGTETMQRAIGLLEQEGAGTFLLAILVSAGLTVLFQSSGVVISLLFSLGATGVLDSFAPAVPFILGAHIGTCSMVILAAPGSTRSGWLVVWGHLGFNLIGAVLATAMLPLYDWLIPQIGGDITRQIANFNTAKQVATVLLLLPVSGLYAKALDRFLPGDGSSEAEEHSHLDEELLRTPEQAIMAVIHELRRQSLIVNEMMRTSLDGLVTLDLKKFRRVHKREDAVDLIKHRINSYIAKISDRDLTPHQSVMLQRLVLASNAVERIGDHVEDMGALLEDKLRRNIWFEEGMMNRLLLMAEHVTDIMDTTLEAMDPTRDGARTAAEVALTQRKQFKQEAADLKAAVREAVLDKRVSAPAMLLYLRAVTILEKVVSHLKALARQERDEFYDVRESNMEVERPLAPKPEGRPDGENLPESFEEALSKLPGRRSRST